MLNFHVDSFSVYALFCIATCKAHRAASLRPIFYSYGMGNHRSTFLNRRFKISPRMNAPAGGQGSAQINRQRSWRYCGEIYCGGSGGDGGRVHRRRCISVVVTAGVGVMVGLDTASP
jgi:hypothetical protein